MKIKFLNKTVLIATLFFQSILGFAQFQIPSNYSSQTTDSSLKNTLTQTPKDEPKAIIFSESFNGTTFPPTGWLNVQLSGTGLWARSSSGTSPTCSPHSGAGMAFFNSFTFSSGTTALLISPSIFFSADSAKVLDFWMYRDPGFTNDYDSVGIYCNTATNLTGARFLGNVLRYNAVAGWNHFSYSIPQNVSGRYYIIFKAYSDYGNNMYIDDISLTGPAVNDIGVSAIIAPQVGMLPGTIIPQITIKNYGNSTQTNIPVSYKIGQTGTPISTSIPSLAPGASTNVSFPPWTAPLGNYEFIFYTDLMNDGIRFNDTLKRNLNVLNQFTKAFCLKNSTQPASFLVENPLAGFVNIGNVVPWVGRAGVYYKPTLSTYKWLVLGTDKVLYSLDTLNGIATIVGATGAPDVFLSGLTIDKTTGTLYASGLDGTYPDFTFNLYTINQSNGIATLVATSPTTGCFLDIACDNQGQLFAIENRPSLSGRLFSVNKTTAELTLIGTNLGGSISINPQDIEFSDDNTLYFAASMGSGSALDGFYTINTTTGVATLLSTFPNANTPVVGLGIKTTLGISISEINNDNQIKIYPNPIKDYISIIAKNKQTIKTISIFSISGQMVYTENVNHFASTINTSNLNDGFYFVKVITNNGMFTEKIIVTK